MTKTTLPKTIYVVRNTNRDESYLLAHGDIKAAVTSAEDSPAVVGTYVLTNEAKYRAIAEEVE